MSSSQKVLENDSSSSSSSSPPTQVVLSFAEADSSFADVVKKSLSLIQNELHVVAKAATISSTSTQQEEDDSYDYDDQEDDSMLDNASRVIALITPNYVKCLACIEQFNECLLAHKGKLQPILIQDTILPKYLQLVQFHDSRPGKVDKIFPALATVVNNLKCGVVQDNDDDDHHHRSEAIPKSRSLKIVDDASSTYDHDSVPLEVMPSFDIFVSYSSRLRAQANAALEILKEAKPDVKCFLDVTELHAGAQWQQTLYNALDNSQVMLFVLTPPFLESSFCREEASIAALRCREGRCQIVAVDAVPLKEGSIQLLPKEVSQCLISKESLFDACDRALKLLDPPEQQNSPVETVETRPLLHDMKMNGLLEANQKWINEFGIPVGTNKVTICMVGHHSDLSAMSRFKEKVDPRIIGTDAVVRIMTPAKNDVGAAFESATIMICALSSAFLGSNFCLNALNIGILRNRADGGYLIPIALEELDPKSTPSFIRLLPALDATSWDDDEALEDYVFQELIWTAACLSAERKWNDCTTLLPNLDVIIGPSKTVGGDSGVATDRQTALAAAVIGQELQTGPIRALETIVGVESKLQTDTNLIRSPSDEKKFSEI